MMITLPQSEFNQALKGENRFLQILADSRRFSQILTDSRRFSQILADSIVIQTNRFTKNEDSLCVLLSFLDSRFLSLLILKSINLNIDDDFRQRRREQKIFFYLLFIILDRFYLLYLGNFIIFCKELFRKLVVTKKKRSESFPRKRLFV